MQRRKPGVRRSKPRRKPCDRRLPEHPDAATQALEGFAELAVAKHAPKRAATILGTAGRLREETGLALSVHGERELKRVAAAARAALGDDAFDQAWREGSAMTLDDALRYALDEQAG